MFDLTSKDGRVNAFFQMDEENENYIPCYFDECEDLRAEYKKEEIELNQKGCPRCEKRALIGKYVKKILPLV